MIGSGAPPPQLVKKQIVINASKDRSRIAIVEDGELVELYIETPDNVRSIGNVYLAEIQKVMPALRAAFVDVGQKQDCFLHFSDLTDNLPQLLALAGEDVPGLDEPVLSLAPPKRVADDENEPDVEESLEIEPAPEESRSRRTSRRRSRGRGRGRGRGRSEEEEEQEETPRRVLPSVIDLTAPAKPRPTRRAPAPPSPEPSSPAPSDEADASSADASASVEDAAPPKKRTRAKAADAAPADDATADAAPADDATTDAAQEQPATSEDDSESAPKKRRRRGRRGRGSSDADHESADASQAEDPASGDEPAESQDGADENSTGTTRSRRSRSRQTDAASAADDASDPDTDGASTDEPKASKSKADKPKSGRKSLPATLDLTSGSASRSRTAPASDDESRDTPSRSRRGTRSDSANGASGRSRRSKRADDSSDGPGDESSPRGFKKPDTAPAESADAESAASEATQAREPSQRNREDSAQDSAEAGEATSRRRSGRGRGRTAEPSGDADARDSAADASSDGRSEETTSRGRSRGGRSGGDTSGGDTSGDEASGDDSRRRSSGKESEGRSGRGRSGNGRSDSGRSGGRSSGRSGGSSEGRSGGRTSIPSNEELLKRGGRIIVKITKEAISNKGPRVSTDLSLAGRFLVLVPAADYVAVSKKIESAKERRRLRTLATNLKPDGFGVIVRTVAEGRDAKSLDTDLRLLADKWRKIQNKLDEKPNPPVLLYQDVNMVSSVIRDLFSEDYDRILVDDQKVFKNVQAYVKAVAPQMADKVELHKGRGQVYRSLGIEKQVEEAFSKRVNMKSGGYLFIETTEAMHVVDVNSGRAGRGKSQKQNLIDVNVEAAREIAKQLRLRDLGGIIVVDFIDLKYDRDRRKVTDALKKAFDKDRAVTKLLPMSDFGLVQITRQRLRPSITANAVDEDGEPLDGLDAMAASGAGEIVQPGKSLDVGLEPDSMLPRDDQPRDDRSRDDRSRDDRPRRAERAAVAPEDATPQALAGKLRGWLEHYRQSVGEAYRGRPIVVRVHPLLGDYLKRGFVPQVTRWRLSSLRGITFRVEPDASIDPTEFDVRDEKSGRSLLKKYDA